MNLNGGLTEWWYGRPRRENSPSIYVSKPVQANFDVEITYNFDIRDSGEFTCALCPESELNQAPFKISNESIIMFTDTIITKFAEMPDDPSRGLFLGRLRSQSRIN